MSKGRLTSISLALLGTVLVWVPLLAPAFLSLLAWARSSRLHFDYLLPAELFPAVLVGGTALLLAALRARARRQVIGWALGVTLGSLVGGQVFAVLSGFASGAAEPGGWPRAVVIASLAAYALSALGMGIGGLFLLRDLMDPHTGVRT